MEQKGTKCKLLQVQMSCAHANTQTWRNKKKTLFVSLLQQAFVIRRRVQMMACATWHQQVLGLAVVNLATVGTTARVSAKLTFICFICQKSYAGYYMLFRINMQTHKHYGIQKPLCLCFYYSKRLWFVAVWKWWLVQRDIIRCLVLQLSTWLQWERLLR